MPEGFVLETIASLLPIAAFALIFWLLLVRPAQRRRKQIASMQAALHIGDSVMMSSGVYGVVTALDGDRVSLEVAPDVVITVARGAISEMDLPAAQHAEPDSGDDTHQPVTES